MSSFCLTSLQNNMLFALLPYIHFTSQPQAFDTFYNSYTIYIPTLFSCVKYSGNKVDHLALCTVIPR